MRLHHHVAFGLLRHRNGHHFTFTVILLRQKFVQWLSICFLFNLVNALFDLHLLIRQAIDQGSDAALSFHHSSLIL